jgi:hypothetical protein
MRTLVLFFDLVDDVLFPDDLVGLLADSTRPK